MNYTIALIVCLAFMIAIGLWPLPGLIAFFVLAIIGTILRRDDPEG